MGITIIFRGFGNTHSSVSKFWMSTVFAVYWLNRLSLKVAELKPLIRNLKKEFFYLGLICAVIFIFAGMRSVFVLRSTMRKEGDKWIPPAMSPLGKKLKMLTITYLVILFLFGGRIYWQLRTIPGLEIMVSPERLGDTIIEFFLLLSATWAIVVFLPGLLLEYWLFTYIDNIYKRDAKKYNQMYLRTVRIMHIVLLSILGAGIYWQYTLVFK